MNTGAWFVGVVLATALIGCSKAPEKAAERMIESALEKDGAKAKVDMSNNTLKITTTDASGQTRQMEMGAAKVTEADVGVLFYPGARSEEGESTRIVGPDAASYTIILHSADAPEKVAGFYRDHLKSASQGKQMMDMAAGDGAMLMLMDDKSKSSIQVHIAKSEKGTDIRITSSKAAK
jgi:hypothetical protein